MSALGDQAPAKSSTSVTAKFLLKRVALPIVVFAPLVYFFPRLSLFYAVCGFYDVARNTGLDGGVVRRYFLGNGILTWLLSPFNIFMDLLSLPYINKGVYQLADLPLAYQAEVKRLIDAAQKENLVRQLEERSKENPRTMIFFKWYGVNVDTFLNIPAFHDKWKYVQTIGVSIFNKKVSTSKHFGPMRATLRVLYNLNDMDDHSAYIVVGDTTSYWRENKLFRRHADASVVQRNRQDPLLPLRRHHPPDDVHRPHDRRGQRDPGPVPQFQFCLL